MNTNQKQNQLRGLSMIELLMVILIISILSTMAVNIYIDQVERARFGACKSEILSFEMALERYKVDVGEYPPSGSGTSFSPGIITGSGLGAGYMRMALSSSLNGFPLTPLSVRWEGPYMEFDEGQLGSFGGGTIVGLAVPNIQILDPWDNPYHYVRSGISETTINFPVDYLQFGGTELPASHPLAPRETYYNLSTFQIFSTGPNGGTLSAPSRGLEKDDCANFTRTIN